MNYWQRRKLRKHLRDLAHHGRGLRNMREDVMAPADLRALDDALANAEASRGGADEKQMTAAAADLAGRLEALTPPCRLPAWRENFEVLVVALGVAMAFRAYFYQPFKIPTGSMQPTLYGISSLDRPASGLWDRLPLKAVKWLATGSWYQEVRVQGNGRIIHLLGDDRKPGYQTLLVAGDTYFIPNDAMARQAVRVRMDPNAGSCVDQERRRQIIGSAVAGDVLWSGLVTAGDFVFVNRWLWNFRAPHRGEVMVFSTSGIEGLPQGTHYIKRMCGLPNERLAIDPPNLLIKGEPVFEPKGIERVARRESLAPGVPPYAGYQVIGPLMPAESLHPLRSPGDSIQLGPDQYFAMGDNTGNSRDSRYWGPVPARNLLGPATIVYWPFTSARWGRIQ